MDLFMLGLLQKMSRGGGKSVSHSSSYTINNTVDYPLLGLSLYGKSTQDGVPTPENPVDIVSVGDSGSINIKSCGKNLLNYDAWKTNNAIIHGTAIFENNGVTITATQKDAYTPHFNKYFPELAKVFVMEGETITLSWEESTNKSGRVYIYPNGGEDGRVLCNNSLQKKLTYKVQSGVSFITFRFGVDSAGDTISYKNIMIERGSEATAYEPYKGTIAAITSAMPLCGIPVDSGGNYTDSNGQQWVCDELIYNADGTGKILKHAMEVMFDGSDDECWIMSSAWSTDTLKSYYIKYTTRGDVTRNNIMCDKYEVAPRASYTETMTDKIMSAGFTGGYISSEIDVVKVPILTMDNWKSELSENPITVVYQLVEPQEIPLSAAEMAELRQLMTYSGVTNISNSGGADMDVKYCTDKSLSECVLPITMGLQKQIDELQASMQKQIDELQASILRPGPLTIPGSYAETIIGPIITEGDE